MLHFVWMCIIGLVAGALAKLIMPGKDPGGIIVTILLGIAGSVVAGFLGRTLGLYQEGQGAGLIMSVIGAILLLAAYRLFKRGSGGAST
ncbi:MAG: GlsB/YeaQ/YmgE family stress response membrane protein [Bryobacteraceae bacterium]